MLYYEEIEEELSDRPWVTFHSTHEISSDTWERVVVPFLEELKRSTGGNFRIEREPQVPAKAGFDLSDIDPARWELLCLAMDLSFEHTEKGFVWSAPGITVVTSNNPLTGENFHRPEETGSRGRTGYVGVEGEVTKVKYFCHQFTRFANYIKNSKWGKRSYI